jgi:predicted O-methyltransferase YrrM
VKLEIAKETTQRVNIGPMCRPEEYAWIYETIADGPAWVNGGLVIEVGCFHGHGTVIMAAAAEEIGCDVLAIDPFYCWLGHGEGHHGWGHLDVDALDNRYLPYQRHVNNMRQAGLEDLIVRLACESESAKSVAQHLKPCSPFLWIDGDHHHPAPLQDWESFSPLVVPGGVVGFHDCHMLCVQQSLDELAAAKAFRGWTEVSLPPVVEGEWHTRAWRRK